MIHDEIARIARKLSDELWQRTCYRYTYDWRFLADVFLTLGQSIPECIQTARKVEFGTCAEKNTFYVLCEKVFNEQRA